MNNRCQDCRYSPTAKKAWREKPSAGMVVFNAVILLVLLAALYVAGNYFFPNTINWVDLSRIGINLR